MFMKKAPRTIERIENRQGITLKMPNIHDKDAIKETKRCTRIQIYKQVTLWPRGLATKLRRLATKRYTLVKFHHLVSQRPWSLTTGPFRAHNCISLASVARTHNTQGPGFILNDAWLTPGQGLRCSSRRGCGLRRF